MLVNTIERLRPVENFNGIYVEKVYKITKNTPQAFILPKRLSEFSSIYVENAVTYKQIAPNYFLFLDYQLYVRTDTYPLLWLLYAIFVFLDKQEFNIKKVIYRFLLWTKNGKDFLPRGVRIDSWKDFFKFYISSYRDK